MNKSILFVDDEKQILKALRRLFIGSEYLIYTAESGDEALKILDENNISLVVSDMRMPVMDGYQLLKNVRDKRPSTIRLILSGYAEEHMIFKAIQDGSANMYLLKPWDNEKLLEIIDQLMSTAEILDSKKLLEAFNGIKALPTIPTIYNRLCSMIERDCDIDDIVKLIEKDQSIAAKVLQMANTTYYSKKTGSIKQAILYLGLTNLRNIVMATNVYSNINNDKEFNPFSKRLLWRHSAHTSKITNLIYEQLLKKRMPESYVTAGLLHDIGKIVLMDNFPKDYSEIIADVINENIDFHNAEAKHLPIDHQEAGGYLLNLWGLPLPLIETTLYHHDPIHSGIINKEIVAVVHVANYYSWETIRIKTNCRLIPEVFDYLGFTQQQCCDLIESFDLYNNNEY